MSNGKYKYKPDTPVSVLLEAYKRINPCLADNPWNDKYAGKTLGEMADGCKDADFNPSWGIWYLYHFGEETDVRNRKKVIAAIKDPMMAFVSYLNFTWLTDDEDKLLEEKFKGKLPAAEIELEKGIVTRAKWQ